MRASDFYIGFVESIRMRASILKNGFRGLHNLALHLPSPHRVPIMLQVLLCVITGLYPTLGCDIQGFRAMGLSVQYWPRWFQDFPAIWLAEPLGANGAHLGILYLARKNLLCVWNKLLLCEIKFSQRRTRPVKSLWWQIVPLQESTNAWKNLTIIFK